jgi:hypothetical protein
MHSALTTVRSTDRDTTVYVVDPATIDHGLPLGERLSLRLAVWLLVHSAHLVHADRQTHARRHRNMQDREHRERTALRATVIGGHLD